MSINPEPRTFRRVDPQGLRSAEIVDVPSIGLDLASVDADAIVVVPPALPVAAPDDHLVEAVQFDGENHGHVLAAAAGEVVRGGVQLKDEFDQPAPKIMVEDRSGTIHELVPGDVLVVHDVVANEEAPSPLEVVKADDFAAGFEEVQRPDASAG